MTGIFCSWDKPGSHERLPDTGWVLFHNRVIHLSSDRHLAEDTVILKMRIQGNDTSPNLNKEINNDKL